MRYLRGCQDGGRGGRQRDVHPDVEAAERQGSLSSDTTKALAYLGYQVIARPGTTATHYVWKSGLQSTLTRWQGLDGEAGKPFLVGIGWVVKCAETKERVDEKKYAVNVKEAEIIFGHKVK